MPQGRHPHALLPHGQACLDALLPGFSAELAAAGAPTCAALEEMRFVIGGHQLARASTGASTILASRPFIEGHVRRRVRALPQVTLIDGATRSGLTTSRDGERVTGVRILRRADGSAEETLAADLVVAATGRAAASPPGWRRWATRAPRRSASTSASPTPAGACRCPPTRSRATSSC